MPIFAIGGIACIGKTTFIEKQGEPRALTDYTQLSAHYPIFTRKTGNSVIASAYSSLVASIHAELDKLPQQICVDRFHWEGAIFEAIFASNSNEELVEKIEGILPVLRKIYEHDGYAGALLVDGEPERHLKFLNARGDHLGREFDLSYIEKQNLAFMLVGDYLGIPVVDVSKFDNVPEPIARLLNGGVLDILKQYN